MFSINDVDFDAEGQLTEKSAKDFNKAILCGDIISGNVWKFFYYNDILDFVDKKGKPEDAGRWDYPVDIIFEFNGKNFCFTYYEGLTENQENEFIDMKAIPVHKVAKTIVVEEWEKVDN